MADESVDELLARLEGQGAFTVPEVSTPRAVLASGVPASDYGSAGNYILGLSRSVLAGPTFGLSKNLEAALAAPFTDKTYAEELADINAQQRAFQGEAPLTSLGAEAGMGYILNPLGALGTIGKGSGTATAIRQSLPTLTTAARTSDTAFDVLSGLEKAGRAADIAVETTPGLRLAQQIVSSVPAQSFATGYLGADETVSSPLMEGLKTGALGTAGSATANVLGRGLQTLGREADRLTLSKYGITATDIGKTLKKAGVAGREIAEVEDIPVLNTVKSLERQGIINAEDDVLNNIGNIGAFQDDVGGQLRSVLEEVNEEADAFPDFQDTFTKKFIKSFSGKAREEVAAAAKAEREAIRSQFEEGGSILDLQNAKVGLNYSWNTRPYTADVQKAVRADLRDEIEKRVEAMVSTKRVDEDFAGKVRELNQQWGQAADLKDVFSRRAASDLGGNVVEDFFNTIRTSGGRGSLNIMSAASGNPVFAAAGQIADIARTTKGKEWLADTFSDPAFQKLGVKLGNLLETYGTGRAFSQAAAAVTQNQQAKETKAEKAVDLELFTKSGAAPKEPTTQLTTQDFNDILSILRQAPPDTGATAATPAKAEKKEISAAGSDDVTSLITKESPFVQAIISVESKGNPTAKSGVGASGLMQLMPATAKDLGVEDTTNPAQNIKGGRTYINQQLKKYDSKELALAAYNWGPGNIDRGLRRLENKGVAATWENLKRYTKVPEETVKYVSLVKKAEREINDLGSEYWNRIRKA